MKKTKKEKKLSDIEKIKNFLLGLGFICNSHPSAQNLIFTKNGDTIIIKNSKI